MVLIVGSEGNMGKRYKAILSLIKEPHLIYDSSVDKEETLLKWLPLSNKVILATPTNTHMVMLDYMAKWARQDTQFLCEKPISKDIDDLERLAVLEKENGLKFFCVNQYAYIVPDPKTSDSSFYNYFKHGSDGIAWDCFQVIGLAEGDVQLSEDSPVWACSINGCQYRIENMDWAYVNMIIDFLKEGKQLWDLQKTKIVTAKVLKWIDENKPKPKQS